MSDYYNYDNYQKYEITINWIRHGESCANIDQGINKDKREDILFNDPNDLDLILKLEQVLSEYEVVDGANTDNHNDIESEYDDLLDINEIAGQSMAGQSMTVTNEPVLEQEIVDSQHKKASANTIGKIISKHAIKKASRLKAAFLYEPNLSFIGMNQAINLGTNYFHKNNDVKNIYITSPLTRTITTALLSLRFVENAIIYVVPYINEKSNAAALIQYDFQNSAVPSNLLKKKIFFIKEWLNEFWITKFDDIEIRNFLKNINRITTNGNLKRTIHDIFDERTQKKDNNSFNFTPLHFKRRFFIIKMI
jgi:hypothetical protein